MVREMPPDLSESDVYVLLAKRCRRLALRVLNESTAPLTALELATRIGERECDELSNETRSKIYISLNHNHLPRLDEADVISYDHHEGTVRPGRNFDDVRHELEDVTERDMPWSDR